ncbi:hypothetical protein XG67_07340 [Salmonella enterica subsp. enterica]|nr:hypothetical protein [Salmonella enterica subsp. enterica]
MVPQSDSNGSHQLVGESVPHSQGMVSKGLLLPVYLLVHSYSPPFDVVIFGDLTISDDEDEGAPGTAIYTVYYQNLLLIIVIL